VRWIINLAVRLSIDAWAGKELVATGGIPSSYEPISRWHGVLSALFTFLAFSGVAAFGAAILTWGLLPHWLGWAATLYSLAGLDLLALTRDSLPALHSTVPLVMGIVLLVTSRGAPCVPGYDQHIYACPTTHRRSRCGL
jgi:hypothetical protein